MAKLIEVLTPWSRFLTQFKAGARDQDVMSFSVFYGDFSLAVSCLLASKVRHR